MRTKQPNIPKICPQCKEVFLVAYKRRSETCCSQTCAKFYQNRNYVRRFWQRVEKTETCWLWKGKMHASGYGLMWINKKQWKAHRVSFLIHNGGVDESLFVLHSCDNRQCVNPAHLRQGTAKENALDAVERGRIAKGQRSGATPFTDEDVLVIKTRIANNEKLSRIARDYKVSYNCIWEILTGKTWQHIQL